MSYQVFLPQITNYGAAQALANEIIHAPEQKRKQLRENEILKVAAQRRAYDMARRNYFDHVTPEGIGPNRFVESLGYLLPKSYAQGPRANNIEDIFGGQKTIAQVMEGIRNSPSHARHVFGLASFFQEQDEYGIGLHERINASKYAYYWVILIAKRRV